MKTPSVSPAPLASLGASVSHLPKGRITYTLPWGSWRSLQGFLHIISMFTHGRIIKEFVSKSGKPIVIRYPREDDAEDLLDFINPISEEDTFVHTHGKIFTLEDERIFLENAMTEPKSGNGVYLFCEHAGKIIGNAHVSRLMGFWHDRCLHVGRFGITLAQDFCGEGLGRFLMETVIEEAKKEVRGLTMIELECFSTNTAGLALYEKLGFRECGRLPGGILHKGAYADNVSMYLNL